MIERFGKLVRATRNTLAGVYGLTQGAPIGVWHRGAPNWGDDFAPYLMQRLSGREPVHSNDVPVCPGSPRYATVGSVIHQIRRAHVVVWGTGLITDNPADSMSRPRVRPAMILAVRGPLTRRRLEALGIPCPTVYGDPALLAPRWLRFERSHENGVCVVPHIADRSDPHVERLLRTAGAHVVNLAGGIEAVVADICKCEIVVSSSLHGLILADAYNIPSVWVSFGDRVLGSGFKFRDYYASIGRDTVDAIKVADGMTLDDLAGAAVLSEMDLDLDALFMAQPSRWEYGCHRVKATPSR